MDCREDQPVKTSTNRLGRITILTLSKPHRRLGSATAVDLVKQAVMSMAAISSLGNVRV
jgi:hypothetical protein